MLFGEHPFVSVSAWGGGGDSAEVKKRKKDEREHGNRRKRRAADKEKQGRKKAKASRNTRGEVMSVEQTRMAGSAAGVSSDAVGIAVGVSIGKAGISTGAVEIDAGVSVGTAGIAAGEPAGVAGSLDLTGFVDIHNSMSQGETRELDSAIEASVRDLHQYPPSIAEVRERLTDGGITNMMILARLELHWAVDEQRIGYVATQTRIVNRANV